MKYFSTRGEAQHVSAREAVVRGLAEDGGLYYPEEIPRFKDDTLKKLRKKSIQEIGFEIAKVFFGNEVPDDKLRAILEDVLSFPVPRVEIEDNISTLELFHGPTLAFKDFGARFMSRLLSYFLEDSEMEVVILVATSGDTGSAVAHGFYKVPGTRVVLLYPKGQVSPLQEKQFTTLGENITALEIDGSFDDCQRMVKTAFVDEDLETRLRLASANSINIARLLPQSFYYASTAMDCTEDARPLVFSVPSGNFGNLTAGLFARRMGFPIDGFVAATNSNDAVPRYLCSGTYEPKPSVSTISNAMDVGDPSNFTRLEALFEKDLDHFKSVVFGVRFDDDQTREAMRDVYSRTGYILDPHGAVAYLGLSTYVKDNPDINGVFLETAHPAKFIETVEETIHVEVPVPEPLALCARKEKISLPLSNNFEELKSFLLDKIA